MASAVLIVILAAVGLGASLVLISREQRRGEATGGSDPSSPICGRHPASRPARAERPGAIAQLLLQAYQPAAGVEDMRTFAWYYLMRLCHAERRTLRGHKGAVYHADSSPDGKTLVSCGVDGTVRFWECRYRPDSCA